MSNSGMDIKVIRAATVALVGSITAIVGGGAYTTVSSMMVNPRVEITNSKPAEVTKIPDYAVTPKVSTKEEHKSKPTKVDNTPKAVISKPLVTTERSLPDKTVYHKVYNKPTVQPTYVEQSNTNSSTNYTPPTTNYTQPVYQPIKVTESSTKYVAPKENTSNVVPQKEAKQVTYTSPVITITYSNTPVVSAPVSVQKSVPSTEVSNPVAKPKVTTTNSTPQATTSTTSSICIGSTN